MAWLLCDYGEVLCLPQPPADRKALADAAAMGPRPWRFWEAYWRHRPGYDRGDVTARDYWHDSARPPALGGSARST